MANDELHQRLSQICTVWTVLRQAHEGTGDEASAAVQLLVQRYRGAAHRYLSSLLGDANAAEDLTQEFSLALLRGEMRNVHPSRGRFRYYVKTVLRHLVSKSLGRAGRSPVALDPDSPAWRDLAGDEAAPGDEADAAFNQSWRDELLARTWEALRQAHKGYHAALRHRVANPDAQAGEMAEALSKELGRAVTPDWVRQTLHRAREKFAELLFDEVANSLDAPGVGDVEEELAELGLLEYCRPLLDRRG